LNAWLQVAIALTVSLFWLVARSQPLAAKNQSGIQP
jgi:hypothetical protein